MVDTLTPSQRSQRMSRIRGKNTSAELIVRKLVHRMGFRFRLHRKDLPGTPDLVFSRQKKVIFVHGCFWHRHPNPECALSRLPKSRLEFWLPKLEGNRARDERNRLSLEAAGWQVLIVWECELGNQVRLESSLRDFLGEEQ